MGTWAGGLVSYDYENKIFTSFNTQNSGIANNNIYSIAKEKSGNLWLGSFQNGLIYFNIKENKFFSYSLGNSDICNIQINVVKIDSKGQLYIGTPKGFQVFIPTENKVINYSSSLSDTKSISNNSIHDILIENDSIVWVATKNGLNQLNPLTGVFKKFFVEQGLPSNTVRGLTLDNSGALWVSTNKGICRFDYRNNNFRNFVESDGLQSNEFYERSIITTKSGAILAGGINGFNLISPEDMLDNKKIPHVAITGFSIFNKEVKIGEKGSPLIKQISETKELTLSYKQSVLTFYFSVLDFTNPQKNQYAYMMENFDRDWVYPGNRNEATYTNLSPGKYIFYVKGSNNDGFWNEKGTTLKITITPPWWQTKIALAAFVLFIVSSFLGIYYFRVNQLKKQKGLLEKLVKERTQEIEEQDEKLSISNDQLKILNATKDRFFSIIAHDLRNPFNNILVFTEILNSNDPKINEEEIKLINKQLYLSATSTYNLLENLLEWSRTQSNRITFQPQQVNFETICNEVIDSLSSNPKNIDIKYLPTEEITFTVDPNMIKTVLRNLISNAIKFSHKHSKVNVYAGKDDLNVTVTVSDNGTGIAKENLMKIFDFTQKFSSNGTAQEKGTGLGLIICKEFVEKHGGQIWVESDPDSHRGGKGSDFKFTIPNKV